MAAGRIIVPYKAHRAKLEFEIPEIIGIRQ